MFQKKFRLPASTRLSRPQTQYSPFFITKFSSNNLEQNRYGFIVSKKVDKRAVLRNRLKRRFRSQVEQLHTEIQQGYDFLFLLKKEAIEQSTGVLSDEIKKVLYTLSPRNRFAKLL